MAKTITEVIDFKNRAISPEERAQSIIAALGMTGTERTVTKGMKKGDVFSLTKMDITTFTPIGGEERISTIFITSNGCNVSPRHFLSVTLDGGPEIGNVSGLNAIFFVWCIDHKVIFKCVKIEEVEKKASDGSAYTQKEFTLTVDSQED